MAATGAIVVNPFNTGALFTPSKTISVDDAGNLYFTSLVLRGTTVAPWGSPYTAIDLGTTGAVEGDAGGVNLVYNGYYSGSSWYRKTTNTFSVLGMNTNGLIFQSAPSGSAGGALTPTQFLAITPYGNMTVGAPASGVALTVNNVSTNPIGLLISGATSGDGFVRMDGASGTNRAIQGSTSGVARWQMTMGNTTAESGSNAGSDIGIYRYADNGAYLGNPLFISRSTGAITLGAAASGSATLSVYGVTGGTPTLWCGGATLGAAVGNYSTLINLNSTGNNYDQLQVQSYRETAGSSWTNASTRLQKVVDVTQQGYIFFGDGGRGTPAGTVGLILGSSGRDALYVNSNGNVTIPAPSSGRTLDLNAGPGGMGNWAAPTGQDMTIGLSANAGATYGYLGLNHLGSMYLVMQDANSLMAFGTQNTIRLTIGAGGGVTIAAPTSNGNGLSVTGGNFSGTAAAVIKGGDLTSNICFDILGNTNTNNPSVVRFINNGYSTVYFQMYVDATQSTIGTIGATPFYLSSNNVQRVSLSSAGNVGIAVPASGPALTINSLTSTYNWLASDGTCQSFLYLAGAGGATVGTLTNHAYQIQTNNTARLVISNTGVVDISAGSGNLTMGGGGITRAAINLGSLTASGFLSANHGGPRIPDIVVFRLRCTTANQTYAVGDEINFNDYFTTTGTSIGGTWCNATQVGCAFRALGIVNNKNAVTTSAGLTVADWSVIAYCHWL